MALIRKMNDYLQSGSADDSPKRVHAGKMEKWLSTLEKQLGASMPPVFKEESRDINDTWAWVEDFVTETLDQISWDVNYHGGLQHSTAVSCQQAIIASFVTGCYSPPPRVFILKTCLHPAYFQKVPCQDNDCSLRAHGRTCFGNGITMETLPPPPESELDQHPWQHFDYLTTDLTMHVVHHKNDK